MAMLEKEPKHFERRLAAAWPPGHWRDLAVLVAVSGGADSVALLRALAGLQSAGAGRLIVAHFNHALRGAESAGDEQFVAALAGQLRLECHVGHAPAGALQPGGDGLEAAARAARYEFLQATAERLGARYLVTAHTADDQAETIVHRLLRGTGLSGLAGMRRARTLGPAVTLLRPMLEIRRREVEEYLAALEQPYRHDASNGNLELTRNRVRHQLLPLLTAEFNPAVVDAILRLGRLAGEAQQTIQAQAEELLDAALLARDETSLTLDCSKLARATRHMVRELLVLAWQRQAWPLQAMTLSHWEELAGLVLARPADGSAGGDGALKKVFPGGVLVVREALRARFTRTAATAARPETAARQTPPGRDATA